jgi:hypothetical protein
MPKTYVRERAEPRLPMQLPVNVSGHSLVPGVERTFTRDVSARGACVVSARRWDPGDRLLLASSPGDFYAVARVAYCRPIPDEGFRVGLEFLEPSGQWVVPPQERVQATV